jgi:uncharacterized BrkB/YihY/UPF0761 family membrane protein
MGVRASSSRRCGARTSPEIEGSVSDAAFKLTDDTVTKVLGERQLWWVTLGFVLAVWALSFSVRWLLAAAVLAVGVGLNVHFGSGTRQELPWVSLGTGLVLACWIGLSIVFGLYVTYVASYASVFGHLATFFVLLLYVHAAAMAFLIGILVDAYVRAEAVRRA